MFDLRILMAEMLNSETNPLLNGLGDKVMGIILR